MNTAVLMNQRQLLAPAPSPAWWGRGQGPHLNGAYGVMTRIWTGTAPMSTTRVTTTSPTLPSSRPAALPRGVHVAHQRHPQRHPVRGQGGPGRWRTFIVEAMSSHRGGAPVSDKVLDSPPTGHPGVACFILTDICRHAGVASDLLDIRGWRRTASGASHLPKPMWWAKASGGGGHPLPGTAAMPRTTWPWSRHGICPIQTAFSSRRPRWALPVLRVLHLHQGAGRPLSWTPCLPSGGNIGEIPPADMGNDFHHRQQASWPPPKETGRWPPDPARPLIYDQWKGMEDGHHCTSPPVALAAGPEGASARHARYDENQRLLAGGLPPTTRRSGHHLLLLGGLPR